MSKEPKSVEKDEPLVAAHRLMQAHRIRHLAVLHEGRLVGVVSERDLFLLETVKNVDPRREPVEEAMTAFPFTVPPHADLADLARQMCQHRYGSALVVEGGRVVFDGPPEQALNATALSGLFGIPVEVVERSGRRCVL